MSAGDLAYTLSFYFFGVIAVIASLVAVSSNRILRAAVGLAVTLVCGAAFYILLNYDFIAAIQILVYVGGIVVLIVYAIMLTSSTELVESHPGSFRKALAILAAILFLVFSVTALIKTNFSAESSAPPPDEIARALGRMILDTGSSGYVLPFEIISLLLLAAVIGAMVIARAYRSQSTDAAKGERSA